MLQLILRCAKDTIVEPQECIPAMPPPKCQITIVQRASAPSNLTPAKAAKKEERRLKEA
jgi:hypothetical protein